MQIETRLKEMGIELPASSGREIDHVEWLLFFLVTAENLEFI
jgi:hypothetical protein